MNKQELITAIATAADMTKADAKKALNGMVEAISETLAKGDNSEVTGKMFVSKNAFYENISPVTPSNLLPGTYSIPIEVNCEFKGAQHFSS